MSAGIKSKAELEIVCDGQEEEKALEELKIAIKNLV
jgi:phosphotransferase system HPr-like phosphotransfer protein